MAGFGLSSLGPIAQGWLGGTGLAIEANKADADTAYKRLTADRLHRQEQMKILGEILKRAEEDPEMTLMAISDPNYASQLGMSPGGFMSLHGAVKSKADEARASKELLRLYGANQLTPEHLETYKAGIPRTVSANKDFAAFIDQRDLEAANAHILDQASKIPNPDERRRALPGIISGYAGAGGPGRAARAAEKMKTMELFGGPMTSVEDQNRIRTAAGNILAMYKRGVIPADVAKSELGLVGMTDLNQLAMVLPQAAREIEELKAAGSAGGKIVGEGDALRRPLPGQDSFGIPEISTSGHFGEATQRPTSARTYSDILSEHSGRVSKHQAAGTYMGPLEAFDLQNPNAPANDPQSYGVTENRRERSKANASQTPELADARKAQAALDSARAAVANLQMDDKNIAAAKKLVDAMSVASVAQHIMRSLPPEDQAVMKEWYQKAQQLIRTSPSVGGRQQRPAPAGGSNKDWKIEVVPTR